MSTALAGLADNRYLIATGWILLLVLWETSAIGILLAAWRTMRSRATAREQHAAAVVAFSVALVLAAATPFAVAFIPSARVEVVSSLQIGRPLASAPLAPAAPGPSAIASGARRFEVPVSPDTFAALAAVMWVAGVMALTIRLLGGLILATTIRRRATPVEDNRTLEIAGRLRAELRLTCPVRVVQSPQVEAPVVIGWRRPTLILPSDVPDHLSTDMVGAILAHEFAHIRRRDYVANVLQSVGELLLFFSPAVVWMSRWIRETREYCCDDVAVARSGDPRDYVQALTRLASLGTINTARPVMGASGPRLVTRVRRLLGVETSARFRSLRLAAFAIMLISVSVTGLQVAQASASRALRATGTAQAPTEGPIPYGYASEQDGSGVDMHMGAVTWDAPVGPATIKNISIEPVAAVRFVAVVENLGLRGLRRPVRMFVSDLLPVSIAPGATAEIAPGFISASQLHNVVAESGSSRLQLFFGLTEVRFANGSVWRITPNPAALDHQEALNIGRPEIPRELIARDAAVVPASSACRDERDRAYSPGALVPIRNEPGRAARCDDGRWVEASLSRR